MTITYVTGDATQPIGNDFKIIAHIVNDEGKWGSGFVVALSKRNRRPEEAYRTWAQGWREGHRNLTPTGDLQRTFKLGEMQLVVYTSPGIYVANMIAQRGVRHNPSAPRAVRYDALHKCLQHLADHAVRLSASVHMPRIGCGLGGGSWDQIEPIIQATLIAQGIPVTVYDLETSHG